MDADFDFREALRRASNGGDCTIGILTGDTFAVIEGTITSLESAGDRAPTSGPMTPYSQRDPRWRSVEYAPGFSIGRWGCYLCCVAMLASAAGYEDTPPEVAAKLRAANVFEGGELLRVALISQAYPKLEYTGRYDWLNTPADMIRVRRELEKGPAIVEVDFRPSTSAVETHFVLAWDFTEDGKDLYISDPWDGSDTLLMERYAEDDWTLSRAILGLRLIRVREEDNAIV